MIVSLSPFSSFSGTFSHRASILFQGRFLYASIDCLSSTFYQHVSKSGSQFTAFWVAFLGFGLPSPSWKPAWPFWQRWFDFYMILDSFSKHFGWKWDPFS
jgi:hypothetical protein